MSALALWMFWSASYWASSADPRSPVMLLTLSSWVWASVWTSTASCLSSLALARSSSVSSRIYSESGMVTNIITTWFVLFHNRLWFSLIDFLLKSTKHDKMPIRHTCSTFETPEMAVLIWSASSWMEALSRSRSFSIHSSASCLTFSANSKIYLLQST